MRGDVNLSDVAPELAMAVGLVALTDASLYEAAQRAGVSRWELEETMRATSLAERLDVTIDTDVREEIDRLYEERCG